MYFYYLNTNKFTRRYNPIKQKIVSVLHDVLWNNIYMPIFGIMIISYYTFSLIAFLQNTWIEKKNYTIIHFLSDSDSELYNL